MERSGIPAKYEPQCNQSAVGTTEKNHPYSVAPTALRFLYAHVMHRKDDSVCFYVSLCHQWNVFLLFH